LGNPGIGAGRLHWLIFDVGARRPHQNWRWPSWIVLSSADLYQLTTFLRQNEQPVWRAEAEIRRCFQKIAQAVTDESVSRLAVFINELFVMVLEMFRREKAPLDESLSSVRRSIELFWSDLNRNEGRLESEWSVAAMARSCGMGVTNFIHQTKQLVNMTPANYLMRCRLEAAAKLLRNVPEATITDIAMKFGFGSSQYFATQFKRRFGCTPSEYRRVK
jgi:AraC family L-rhamnose operon regulatory protein RhaS